MANTNAPSGLRPVMNADGSPWSGGMTTYYVQATDPTALYIGDPVIRAGSGDANGIPDVIRATAGTSARVTGTVVGFGITPALVANGAYRPASTAGYVKVADGVSLTYEIQASGSVAVTDIGANANFASGTGNTIQGSGFQLDVATIGTQATKQLNIMGFSRDPTNEVGANAKLLVRINLPTEAGIASGVGV